MADQPLRDAEYVRLRDHLIEAHGYQPEFFDNRLTLDNLRWLHAPWVKTREYPKGCER
jgi:hypothetical protein